MSSIENVSIYQELAAIKDPYKKLMIVKDVLSFVKDLEMELRLAIADRGKLRGEVNAKNENKRQYEENGYRIKIEYKTNLSFEKDSDKNPLDYDEMSDDEKACFQQKWEINESKYKKLKEKHGEENLDIFRVVTEKPGAPVVEIIKLV